MTFTFSLRKLYKILTMQKLILTLGIFTSILVNAQSFEVVVRDTINMTNANGKKQGKWIVSGFHNTKSGYNPNQKIEEGFYIDNKKTGVWKQYYKSGNVKNKITFSNGRPNGPCTMFYENGKIDEEGTWIDNHWVGVYKKYSENGKILHEFNFDTKGKLIEKDPKFEKSNLILTK